MSRALDVGVGVPLVLASASPRRHELLSLLGAPFVASEAAVDESAAVEPALEKARAVRTPGRTVIAADTRIRFAGTAIGKPADSVTAVDTLVLLAGREHTVVTDVAVIDGAGREMRFLVRSRVRMRSFSREEAERYVATGEPFDAAGSYQVQRGGAALVEYVDGCLANVVGFPLCHVYEALRRAGRAFIERPEIACQRHFSFVCPVWKQAQAQGRALGDGAAYDTWSRALEARSRVHRRVLERERKA